MRNCIFWLNGSVFGGGGGESAFFERWVQDLSNDTMQ
jgi:hypothetical protein